MAEVPESKALVPVEILPPERRQRGYFGVIREEFTTVTSRWRTIPEAVVNISGYCAAVYLWWIGAANWQVITVGGLSAFLTSAFVYQAGEAAWRKEHSGRLELEQKLRSGPNLRIDRIESGTVAAEIEHGHATSAFDVWELWFVNRPGVQSEQAVARGLTAWLEFCDEKWEQQLSGFVGQWAHTRMPDHVGWDSTDPCIDLAPTFTYGKLLVIAQNNKRIPRRVGNKMFETGAGVHALSGENIHVYRTVADHPEFYLDMSVVHLRVSLRALNMNERIYRFKLERDDEGWVKQISEITT